MPSKLYLSPAKERRTNNQTDYRGARIWVTSLLLKSSIRVRLCFTFVRIKIVCHLAWRRGVVVNDQQFCYGHKLNRQYLFTSTVSVYEFCVFLFGQNKLIAKLQRQRGKCSMESNEFLLNLPLTFAHFLCPKLPFLLSSSSSQLTRPIWYDYQQLAKRTINDIFIYDHSGLLPPWLRRRKVFQALVGK